MRDVKDAAHPRGTSVAVRDLFFNVPARRKFLRSEATESFHLTNLLTHYALAHPEIAFTLTNNGREILRAPVAQDLRERAYQIFGEQFLENLLAGRRRTRSGSASARLRFRAARPAHLARCAIPVCQRPLCARPFDWPCAFRRLPLDPAARCLSRSAFVSRDAAWKKST